MLPAVYLFALLPPLVNDLIQVTPGLMIRGDDQRPVRIGDVRPRNGDQSLVAIPDFVHAALIGQLSDCPADLTLCEVLDDPFECGITLAKDLIQPHRLQARPLQLAIRSTRFDGVVLAHVAHEQDPIVRLKTVKKPVDLTRTRQARFIEDEHTWRRVRARLLPHQMVLEGIGGDPRVGELLGGPRRGRQSFHAVTRTLCGLTDRCESRGLARSRDSLQCHDLIAARQNLFDGATLMCG
jgi:hypothetical protein